MARGLPFWSRLFARLMCSRKTDEVLVTHRSPSCAQGAARHQGILALEAWKLATQRPEQGLALSTCSGYSVNVLFGWRYRVPHAHAWSERRRHTTKTALAARAICDWAPASTLRQHQHRAEQSLIHSLSRHAIALARAPDDRQLLPLLLLLFARVNPCWASWQRPLLARFDLPQAHAARGKLIAEASSAVTRQSLSPTDSFRPGRER